MQAYPTLDFSTPAQRPNYSLLDKRKIKSVLGINITDYHTSLENILENLIIRISDK
jgi:dTDP-4-dehydrorhamnose reductase